MTTAKPRKKTKPAKKKTTGRPSSFRPEFVEQGRHIALLGATDVQLAEFFSVSVATLKNWRAKYPEFLTALKSGKLDADANVARSLYRRALGYSHKAVKIFAKAETGQVVQVPYTERHAPDTTACIFWLKNRQPALWRDRQPEGAADDPQDIASAIRDALRRSDEAEGLAA